MKIWYNFYKFRSAETERLRIQVDKTANITGSAAVTVIPTILWLYFLKTDRPLTSLAGNSNKKF
jgi:hypothetical protein